MSSTPPPGPPTRPRKPGRATQIVGCVGGLALMIFMCGMCGGDVLDGLSLTEADLPPVDASIPGADAQPFTGKLDDLKVHWAEGVREASSEQNLGLATEYAPHQATGAPDVFPVVGDNVHAWSPGPINVRQTLSGEQWIILEYAPTDTGDILVVESHAPGSLVRVDDLTDTATILWAGLVPANGSDGRILRIHLPTPRRISALRLNFDVHKIDGRPQLDAVGLVEP